MTLLAESPEQTVSNQDLAALLDVSAHHLAKVHQRLARAGLVKAVRGPNGGCSLAKPAETITLLDVVVAIDGGLNTDQCLLGRAVCQRVGCPLGKFSDSINQQVVDYFKSTTIDKII